MDRLKEKYFNLQDLYFFPWEYFIILFPFQYFIVVLLLFIILLIGGILGYVFKDKAETSISHTMMGTMRDYGTSGNEQITKAWDETQQAVSAPREGKGHHIVCKEGFSKCTEKMEGSQI